MRDQLRVSELDKTKMDKHNLCTEFEEGARVSIVG
jgi:hypothetical protein